MFWLLHFTLNIQCAIGKLSSKLHKNKNNTDITLYQICLPKLHKISWNAINSLKKCYWLKPWHSDNFGILCKPFQQSSFLNCWMWLLSLPHFIFSVAWSFAGLSLNCTTHMIIKGIKIWWVKQPNTRRDVVAEFSDSQDWLLLRV